MKGYHVRAPLWQAMRRLGADGGEFDVHALRGELPGATPRDLIRRFCHALTAAGYLHQVSARPLRWALIRDPGIEPPAVRIDGQPRRMGSGREQMWRAMRILRSWTVAELVATASTEAHRIAPAEALTYCNRLARAGYLRRQRGPEGLRFTLPPAAWTGPLPVQVRRDKTLLDPNTGRVMAADGSAPEVRR